MSALYEAWIREGHQRGTVLVIDGDDGSCADEAADLILSGHLDSHRDVAVSAR